jgi:hypothetical protein
MATHPRLVLVDTNCLVRVYFSPLRPILGRPVAGYELKTLDGLARELKNLAQRADLAWLSDQVILQEVDAATVALTKLQRDAIDQDALYIQRVGNAALYKDYQSKKLRVSRTLSLADAKVLAASLELDAALSTDEWPLRLVSELYDYDNGQPIALLSSVELIELLERDGLLSRDERVKTYSDWLKNGEALLRESPKIYYRLFKEAPPTAQG